MLCKDTEIEVAGDKSRHIDASGSGRRVRKGDSAEGSGAGDRMPGHTVKNCMTVIERWGAIRDYLSVQRRSRIGRRLFYSGILKVKDVGSSRYLLLRRKQNGYF